MKGLAVVVLLGLCGVVYCKPGDAYTTKYDNVDLDAIIKNDRLLKNYVDCLLDKKSCTKDGQILKDNIEDALKNKCAKCSEAQKNGSRKIIRHLIKEKRAWWDELQQKYDHDNVYVKTYGDELKAEGIVL